MKKKMVIKGITINEGEPAVCVPVTGKTAAEALGQAREAVGQGVPMIEWRADYFAGLSDGGAVAALLEQLAAVCRETILLATLRTKPQGGEVFMTEAEVENWVSLLATARCADMADVEFFQWKHAERMIGRLRQEGIRVVASHHDFEKTPSDDEMSAYLERMRSGGADIVKLAVMPESLSDTLRLMDVSYRFGCLHPDTPMITMAMGKSGMLSRIAGEYVGSCVTFGCLGHASAPGQLPAGALRELLAGIHGSLEGER